jgi:hypothetical protein
MIHSSSSASFALLVLVGSVVMGQPVSTSLLPASHNHVGLPPFIIVSTATAEEGSSACLGLLVLIIGEGNWVLGRNEI